MTYIRSSIRHRSTARRRSRGFTLIELLVVVAIIGIIASILIPSLLDALQKAKQRRAMTDMQLTGTAWMSWLTDFASSAAAGRGSARTLDWSSSFEVVGHAEVVSILVPQFAFEIPPTDPWTHVYEYRLADSPGASNTPFGMRSGGADGTFDTDSYERGGFVATDYDQDIAWAAGYFVRWPRGINTPGS